MKHTETERLDGSFELYRYFFGAYPWRSTTMIGLMVLAGLAEGVGVVTLVPLLESLEQAGPSESGVSAVVTSLLDAVGLEPTLAILLGLVVLALTAKALMLFVAGQQIGYTVAQVVTDLRLRLMRALMGARWSYFQRRRAGEFANAVATEAHRASIAYRGACQLVATSVQMLSYILVAALISLPIAVAAVILGAVLTRLLRRIFSMSRAAGVQQTLSARELTARLVDVLSGIKPLKAMNREGLVWPLLEHETESLNRSQRREVLTGNLLTLFQEPALTLALALGMFYAVRFHGESLSTVLVLAFLFYRLVGQVNKLQISYNGMVVGESAFHSLNNQTLEAIERREPTTGGRVFERLRQGVVFDGVDFSYGSERVLNGLDLEIPAGDFVAIHGPSGSGKTTMADLLVGLHEPQSGRILVDGVPLVEWNLASWRRAIGYVPQDVLLFSDSVLNNVTLGDPSVSRDDAEWALRQAGAWEFVSGRAEGLDSDIGAISSTLSGGQRQRIAIARALVGRPSILILDEVTAALDPETEQAICKTLAALEGEVTIFSISHQAALREAASIAYQMEDGRVEPVGVPIR